MPSGVLLYGGAAGWDSNLPCCGTYVAASREIIMHFRHRHIYASIGRMVVALMALSNLVWVYCCIHNYILYDVVLPKYTEEFCHIEE